MFKKWIYNFVECKTVKQAIIRGTLVALLAIGLAITSAFAFTRDWDETDPIDHSKNNTWPAEIREVMVDVAERLTYLYGFSSGETAVGAKKIPFEVQGSDPGAIANQIQCYSKDDSAKAELFCQDEDGNVIQITSAGALNVPGASSVCTTTFFVGYVWISTVSTNPGTSLGCGTWTAAAEGRVLIGVGTSDQAFSAAATGGSSTHTLTEAELASHNHDIILHQWEGQNNGTNPAGSSQDVTTGTNTTDISNSGSGSAHNNLQPYLVVYIFERTA